MNIACWVDFRPDCYFVDDFHFKKHVCRQHYWFNCVVEAWMSNRGFITKPILCDYSCSQLFLSLPVRNLICWSLRFSLMVREIGICFIHCWWLSCFEISGKKSKCCGKSCKTMHFCDLSRIKVIKNCFHIFFLYLGGFTRSPIAVHFSGSSYYEAHLSSPYL